MKKYFSDKISLIDVTDLQIIISDNYMNIRITNESINHVNSCDICMPFLEKIFNISESTWYFFDGVCWLEMDFLNNKYCNYNEISSTNSIYYHEIPDIKLISVPDETHLSLDSLLLSDIRNDKICLILDETTNQTPISGLDINLISVSRVDESVANELIKNNKVIVLNENDIQIRNIIRKKAL